MLECIPRSMFSWTRDIHGLRDGPGEVTFDYWTEQGTLSTGSEQFEVQKQGVASGRWYLLRGGRVVAAAYKPSAFRRVYGITSDGPPLTLRATTAMSRVFEIAIGNLPIGEIAPTTFFSRRATIECAATVPPHIQVFAFWLVVLSWRRSRKNSN